RRCSPVTAECRRKMALAGKTKVQRNGGECHLPPAQQTFRTQQPAFNDEGIRSKSGRRLEPSREAVALHSGDRGHLLQRDILAEIRLDIVPDPDDGRMAQLATYLR